MNGGLTLFSVIRRFVGFHRWTVPFTLVGSLAVYTSAVSFAAPGDRSPLPEGTRGCVDTVVKRIEVPADANLTVAFANGVHLVGDWGSPKVAAHQHVDDPVQVCLISTPTGCPPGDDRGKRYRVFDQKQQKAYVLADSLHVCGGA